MTSSRKTFFYYFLVLSLGIFSVEAALEFRHYHKGYNTLLFGTKESGPQVPGNKTEVATKVQFGPNKSFPFRSIILDPNSSNAFRIWIASASHAEGGRVNAKNIFPNRICESLPSIENCEVINGSKAGMTIGENITQLNKFASIYKPEIAILYQMSIVISSQERKLLSSSSTNNNESNSILDLLFDIQTLSKTFQKTALYIHLSDYIGGNIKLQGPLKDRLPADIEPDFDKQILDFINASKKLGIKPILTTFAASHNSQNLDEMHFSLKTNFVKYNTYLSPIGWTNMVETYNHRIKNIAKNNNIPLIDLDNALTGQYEYFIDYVHFNEKGHEQVAKIIGKSIDSLAAKGL